MKRFECEVTRRDKYIIEIDETVMDEEWMEHYSKYFHEYDSYEEHAEHIAQFRARFGERHIEGYGDPMVNGKKPFMVKDEHVNKSINIKVVDEDTDCYIDVTEVE